MNKASLLAAAALVVSSFTAGAYAQTSNANSNAGMASHAGTVASDTSNAQLSSQGSDASSVSSSDATSTGSGAAGATTAQSSGSNMAPGASTMPAGQSASAVNGTPATTDAVNGADASQSANYQAQSTTQGAGTVTADNGPATARNDYPRCSRSVRDSCIQRGRR